MYCPGGLANRAQPIFRVLSGNDGNTTGRRKCEVSMQRIFAMSALVNSRLLNQGGSTSSLQLARQINMGPKASLCPPEQKRRPLRKAHQFAHESMRFAIRIEASLRD